MMTDQQGGTVPAWGRSGGHFSLGASRPDLARSVAEPQEIVEVIHRYGMAYDERDLEVLRSTLADDATWQGTIGGEPLPKVEGGDAIVTWLAGIMEGQRDQRRHLVVNPVIEDLARDSARIVTYIVVTAASGLGVSIATSGFYDVSLIRRSGRWQIRTFIAGFDVSF
jgi:hypothetical protein